jgi:polyhydroxyalkanoate synthesis repressor PhaR
MSRPAPLRRATDTAPRIIKKYPNRRLYDTEISSYVTLGDLRALILEFELFVVQDAKSGEDLTRTVLLQIIGEYEESGQPIFTNQLLQQIIRAHGDPMAGLMGKFLEDSLRQFMDQQGAIRSQWLHAVQGQPLALVEKLHQQQLEWLQIWQKAMVGK